VLFSDAIFIGKEGRIKDTRSIEAMEVEESIRK
jgi:hypothetical protein